MIVINNQTVLFNIFIYLGSVFSEMRALKSFNCLISSLTEAPETLESLSLWLTSSGPWFIASSFFEGYPFCFWVAKTFVSSNRSNSYPDFYYFSSSPSSTSTNLSICIFWSPNSLSSMICALTLVFLYLTTLFFLVSGGAWMMGFWVSSMPVFPRANVSPCLDWMLEKFWLGGYEGSFYIRLWSSSKESSSSESPWPKR